MVLEFVKLFLIRSRDFARFYVGSKESDALIGLLKTVLKVRNLNYWKNYLKQNLK